ncbi:hypothetical protein ACFX14_026393 [Malus domestica]
MVDNNVNDHSIVEITGEDGDVIARINGNSETSREHKNQVELTVSSLRGKLHRQPPFPACSCIFRVPKVLRRHNEKAFVPNLVSIGPFHHGDENLRVMEEIKRWYLHSLLERKPTPKTSLECFVEEIGRIEQKHRDCYGEKFDIYSGKFVEMMVLDGCFIIELLRRCDKLVPWDDDDPLEYTSWMLKVLQNDLFLLENQLPWKVLKCLFDLTKVNDDHSLLALALKFFESSVFNQTPQIKEGVQTKHLLDAVRESLISLHKPQSTERRYWEPIPTVTELLQAGVKFKSKSKVWNNMLDITFKNGVMEIPPIDIESNAESHFRNLIAYEHCDPDIAIFNITSYAVILDNLIQSSEDAEFLIQKRIITTILSKEDLACFFNGLYKDTIPSHFSYVELTEKVNAHYNHRWYRWRTILSRDYFSNPWSIMSFIAALVILVLTFLQTLYSLLTYY